MKCVTENWAARSLSGMSFWKEPSRKRRPAASCGAKMDPSAAFASSLAGCITPGSAHEAWTADRTRIFGALTWLSRVAVPFVEKGVEVEMETTRPVRAWASANVMSSQMPRMASRNAEESSATPVDSRRRAMTRAGSSHAAPSATVSTK
eukprot:scaffold12924_cov125-Isochrysis_galbana.AAC.20